MVVMANKTAVRPKCKVSRKTRSSIEALFGELATERLAGVWQRLYPLPIDPKCEMPDRQGIIEDLEDFAEVLHPNLDRMDADQLCSLMEMCGTK
jgi:hypothetical protein